MTKRSFKNKKLLIILGSIAVVAVAAIIIWRNYKYKVADKEIKQLVTNKSKGLYKISYSNLFINEASGIVQMKDIFIAADTAVYNELKAAKKHPEIFFNIRIPQLNISGVKTAKALLGKQIIGEKIEIINPQIDINLTNAIKQHDDTTAFYKQILGNLDLIKVNTIVVTNAALTLNDYEAKDTKFKGSNVSVTLHDFIIDSLHGTDTARLFFSKYIGIQCEEGLAESSDKKYKFRIAKFDFNSKDQTLNIGRIDMQPKLSEAAFLKANITQTDRFDISVENIALKNMNPLGLLKKTFEADELVIGRSRFNIYRDLAYPRDKKNRVGTYPQQAVMKLPVKIAFKKVTVNNTFIEYKEKNPLSNNSGKVQFYKVHATISNLTNMPAALAKNNIAVLHFSSSFLNKAPLKAELTMYLQHPQGKFLISGSMNKIKGSDLNALAIPMGLVKIESGIINSVSFNLTGNDYAADGTLKLLYNDLKVSLLEKEGKEYDKKKVTSLIANAVVKNENPKNGETRQPVIHHERDINRSFFNLIWKAIFAGAKETVGMK